MPEVQSPYFIDWAITSHCNLNCRHCRGMLEGELSTATARRLITEIAELTPSWVIVEGGEALLRQDLFSLLEMMRQKGLEVHLITNAMLLTPAMITTLNQFGIKLMISIDGATQATYEAVRPGADFETVLKVAQLCVREGLLEAINFAVLKQNYTQIPGIFELAARIGVPKITLIGLKPCHNYSEELLTPEECARAIALACEGAQATGVEFFFDEPFFWAVVKEHGLKVRAPSEGAGILTSATTACIFGEYLFIEPNGEVRPCSFAPIMLGNVKDKPLTRIWDDLLKADFFQRIKDPRTRLGPCQKCHYLDDCMGCRSRTFILTEDWFASDPCCPLNTAQKRSSL